MSQNPSFVKIGECLYRNPETAQIFALIKWKGKQFRRSLKTTNLQEARRKLPDFRAEVERLDLAVTKMTMGDLAERFLATIANQAAATRTAKTRACTRFLTGRKNSLVKDVRPSEVRAFLAGFSGASLYNGVVETLRTMFALAVADRVIVKSPMEGIVYRRREAPIRQTPTMDEFRAIVESIRIQKLADTSEESADLVEFMGLAGLGKAEAGALTWGMVDMKRGQIIAFRQKTRSGFAVPIFPQLRPLIERRLAKATAENGGNPPPAGNKVFAISDPKKALAAACERLKLPNYSSRAFRRMFITTAIERGVDVKVIAQWQGHKDGGKLILDTYSHVRAVHSQQMAELMV